MRLDNRDCSEEEYQKKVSYMLIQLTRWGWGKKDQEEKLFVQWDDDDEDFVYSLSLSSLYILFSIPREKRETERERWIFML